MTLKKNSSFRDMTAGLRRHKSFLLTTHGHADADALASELVMAQYLASQGKKVTIINAEKPPSMHGYIPGVKKVRGFSHRAIRAEAVIVFDCGDLGRIEEVRSLIRPGVPIINIDHHVTNRFFGHLNWVFPKASSTTEILWDFLKRIGWVFDRVAAKLFYIGIMTDTGSFRYDSTTPHSHLAAGELLRHGFSVGRLYREAYENIPPGDFPDFINLLKSYEAHLDGQVISVCLKEALWKKFSGSFDLRERLFTFLRSVKGAGVIAIFTETTKGKVKVNFRSLGRVDVAKIASRHNGGGHQKASGCLLKGSLARVKEIIIGELKRVIL